MSYAYTPGLKVLRSTIVDRQRILPIPGKVLVQEGDYVSAEKIIAETYMPSGIEMVTLAYAVGVEPYQIREVLVKKEGETVKEGELLASCRKLFGLRSPTDWRAYVAHSLFHYCMHLQMYSAMPEHLTLLSQP